MPITKSPRRRPVSAVAILFGIGLMTAGSLEAQQATSPQVTFAKDIAPVLQRSCQGCHRAGGMAPMALTTYQETRPWARSIRQRVTTRQMPPWHVDRTVGIKHYKNDPSLTDEEIGKFAAWVDSGAPLGNPADLPPARKFADDTAWFLGPPDLVVSIPKDHVIPANDADWWGNYLSDPVPLTEARYIRAVQIRPSPQAVQGVHHAGASVTYASVDKSMDESESLGTYNPGRNGDIYPDDAGVLIKPGARISFGLHYNSYGEEVRDRTSVGLWFHPKGVVPKYVQESARLMPSNDDLDIPPGADNVRFDSYHRFDKHVKMIAYGAHMHTRGKRQCLEAIYPDTLKTEILSCVDFDFNWQLTYYFAEDQQPLLPAGTILHVISWFDNSANNKSNPDPKNWVGYGQRTTDEMARNHTRYVFLTDEQLRSELETRKAKSTTTARERR